MEKYDTMKVNPHGGGIQAPGLLGSMSEVHGVLSVIAAYFPSLEANQVQE